MHLPEQVEQKNPSQVKARLDSSNLISAEVSTKSSNRHGEFTRTQTFTFIDEANVSAASSREVWEKDLRYK